LEIRIPTPTARTHAAHSPTTLANDDAYAGDHNRQTDGHDAYAEDEEDDAYERDDGTSYNNGDTGHTNGDTGNPNDVSGTPHDSADDVLAAWPPHSTWDPIFADLWREMEGGESSSHVSSEPV
jgi:hypothetical protein